MSEQILVEVECVRSTSADIDYFEKDGVYTIDMAWAKARGIWKYFKPLREVPNLEAEERIKDEVVPARDAIHEENQRANADAEAHLAEKQKADAGKGKQVRGHATRGKATK